MQLSNIDRKTDVVRVPRKYKFIVQAFIHFLRHHPEQGKLWGAEEYFFDLYEEAKKKNKHRTAKYFADTAKEFKSSLTLMNSWWK